MTESAQLGSTRILMAEDNPSAAYPIRARLQAQGYLVESVATGNAALTYVLTNAPQLMIIDYRLADMNTQTLIAALAREESPLPFLVTIGVGDEQATAEILKLGAYDCLVKDARLMDRLLAAVDRIVERLALEKRLAQAENAMRESDRFFQGWVQQSSDGIVIANEQGQVVEWNTSTERLTGLKREAVLGRPVWEVQAELAVEARRTAILPERLKGLFKTALQTGQAPFLGQSVEGRLQQADGTQRIVEQSAFPISTGQGFKIGMIVHDITARRQAEAALRESEALYHLVIDNLGEGAGMADPQERFIFANPAAEQLFGVAPGGLTGRSLLDFLMTPEQAALVQSQTKLRRQGEKNAYELEIVRPDGEQRTLLLTATSRHDEGGHYLGAFGVFRDMTEQNHVQAALRRSEDRLRSYFDHAPFGVFIADEYGNYLEVNPAACAITGYTQEELLRMSIPDLLPPEARAAGARGFRQVLETGQATVELAFRHKTGQLRAWSVDAVRLSPTRLMGFAQDITARRHMEESLRVKGKAIATAINAVVFADLAGRLHDVNAAFLTMWGYDDPAEVLGQSVNDFWAPDGAARDVLEALPVQGQWHGELDGKRRDGSCFHVLASAHLVKGPDDEPVCLMASFVDITERKLAEAALRANEASLQAVLRSTADGILAVDPENRVLFANEPFAELWKIPPAVLASRDDAVLLQHVLSQLIDPASFIETVQSLYESEAETFDTLHFLDGRVFERLSRSLQRGVKRGGRVWSFRDVTARVRSEQGRQQAEAKIRELNAELEERVAIRTAELSARTAELRQANAELVQANRLKDEFLANMSHELRTPLTAILGLAEALQMGHYGLLPDKQAEKLQVIRQSGQHLLELITEILDLSRIEAGKMVLQLAPTAVADVCEAGLQFIRQTAQKKNICMTFTRDPQVELLQVDARRLKQMLVNLLNNAVKFTPPGGQVGLEVTSGIAASDLAHPEVHFTVWDTGIGIPPEKQALLFRPFVQVDGSLSRRYEGTGLGLALTRRLAEMHGGHVCVESAGVDQGSRFTLSLPWQPVDIPASPPCQATPRLPTFSLHLSQPPIILLAEDNEAARLALGDFIKALPARLLTAHDGEEALTQAQTAHPDLIVMDIQMLGLNGLVGVIRRMKAAPETARTPIIALTTLTLPDDRERCLAAGADDCLSKPVKLGDLAQAITQIIHRPKANGWPQP